MPPVLIRIKRRCRAGRAAPGRPKCLSAAARGRALLPRRRTGTACGRHLREDLPGLMDGLRQAWPGLAFELAPPVGESPALVDLMARLALQESNTLDDIT